MDNNSILEKITEQYSAGMARSKRASSIRKKIEQGTATYAQAEEMARECSRQLNKAFRDNLPDAVNNNFLYRETAEVVVRKPINQTAGDVADAAKKIQAALNEQAEIGMNPIVPDLNEDQVDGIITGICNQPYSTGQNEFFSQVENLMEGYVDDFVHDNADFQYEAGLSPTIERTAVGKCCKWCDNLTGVYPYEKVQNPGNDVFRRHKNCHCQVLYNPGDGSKRRQNVHNRRWTDSPNPDIISQRSRIPMNLQQFAHKSGEYRAQMYKENWQKASLKETISQFARGAKPDKRDRGKTYYTSRDGKISVVYDRNGNYFRILDEIANRNHEKKPYLDLKGNRVYGQDYEMLTHFLNTDKGGD